MEQISGNKAIDRLCDKIISGNGNWSLEELQLYKNESEKIELQLKMRALDEENLNVAI